VAGVLDVYPIADNALLGPLRPSAGASGSARRQETATRPRPADTGADLEFRLYFDEDLRSISIDAMESDANKALGGSHLGLLAPLAAPTPKDSALFKIT
jgi:hypothetical protein